MQQVKEATAAVFLKHGCGVLLLASSLIGSSNATSFRGIMDDDDGSCWCCLISRTRTKVAAAGAKKQELSDAEHRGPTKTGDNIKCYCIASY